MSRRLGLIFALMTYLSSFANAQNGALLGRSLTWQAANAPFTPDAGAGAIVGGPGADPNPNAPLYICRASIQGSLVPGKWVQGNCNVPYGGAEQVMSSYEVAYGSARWGAYQGGVYGLAQTGRDAGGNPLFSCRVHYIDASGQDYGYQPGELAGDGTCHIPFGGADIPQAPPFEVLYATGGGRPPWNPPYPPPYNPYVPPQVQPYPPCKLGDPGTSLDISTGWWVGPTCSSIDAQGQIRQLKYPQPAQYTPPPPPPPPYQPGPSSVTWQPAQSPFVPGQNAIMGGPGNGPKPGAPLYICRVQYNNNLFPGKWVDGECHFSDDAQKEQTSKTYEVANGPAQWRDFDGNVSALVPGGQAADGTQIYICRKQISTWGSNRGYQPGWLENGQCHIPYAVDLVFQKDFQALYNVMSATTDTNVSAQAAASTAPAGAAASPQAHGILITLTGGAGATAGVVTVTNGSTGTIVSKPLPAYAAPNSCLDIVQQAVFQAGLQMQAQPDGQGLRVYGLNNTINVTGVPVSVSTF